MSIYDQPVRPSSETGGQGAFVASTPAAAKKQRGGAFSESRDQHYAPALVRSTAVILICMVAMVAVVVFLWITLPPASTIRVSVAGSIFVTAIGFFLSGNTFRLRDIRRRIGNRARAGLIAPIDALSELPPRDTIHRRFLIGAVSAFVGLLALILTAVFASGENQGNSAVIAPVIGGIFAMLCFLAGSYSRPID
ncbi:hypothetical protein I6A84_35465 [Frankia sp. CNm7]|uniref:Uncharacterized protein n=1 Tax=Frankia nepalensis TaxID=1836974 RepID=A0A937UNR5_9ACTN|nr:hypothetical protein [Frankia nepalensis]MBL7494803.1 hypothetical protein [Frankia nepalensis]MBL7514100.1 hypothetical protein [Frankia nepalensis]MBL7523241.1 hypothetical protein [Frankia nepalensis]MBL7626520.1 hypothetical protein [Frankia nepalensis]